jgi:hypothetical protein
MVPVAIYQRGRRFIPLPNRSGVVPSRRAAGVYIVKEITPVCSRVVTSFQAAAKT